MSGQQLTMLLFSLFVCCSVSPIWARQLPDLYWNSSNALFRADQQGGAHQLTVEIMDSLTIHCPHYNDSTLLEQTETAIIYRVSKHSFDNCVLDETSKPVAQCSDPFNVVSIRLVFRRFTPLPSGLEYQPGETYYFISTSDGTREGMNLKQGGLCAKENRRMQAMVVSKKKPAPALIGDVPTLIEDSSISPKFHQPKLRDPVKLSSNSLDIEPASRLPPSSSADATLPPYWDEFLRKVIEGREGPSYWRERSGERKESFAITDDSQEAGYPIIYNTVNGLNAKRRELSSDQGNSVMSDESDRRLDASSEKDLEVKLFEIHETNDFSLPYRSSSPERHSSVFLHVLLISVCLAVRRIFCSL